MTDWFARPIFCVADVEASLRFYVDKLGFTNPWRYEEQGKVYVAQVERQGAAVILSATWPDKTDKAFLFVSLNAEPPTFEAGTAALDELRAELESRGVAVKDGQWGFRLLVVEDPDGNQLLFNYPKESESVSE